MDSATSLVRQGLYRLEPDCRCGCVGRHRAAAGFWKPVGDVGVTLFGTIFLFALLKAHFHIRKREIAQHREWMIRAFALGLGIATFRVQLILLQSFTDYGFVEIWDTVAWFGFATNLIIAEIWINVSRGGVKNKN